MALPGLLARLTCREYKNWMKAGMCLEMLQSRLHRYIDHEMRTFHQVLSQQITAPRHRRRCQCRSRGKQFEPGCPVCAQWKELILAHHNNRTGEIHWGNSNPSLWPTHYWEVAKVYMPHGQAQFRGPEQCDAAALLNLLNNCNHFQVENKSRLKEMIKCRNELMHSFNMKVSSPWLEAFGQKMRNLISEFTHVPDLVTEGQKMEEVLLSDWNVDDLGINEVDGIPRVEAQGRIEFQSYSEKKYTRLFPYEVERRMINQMIQELYQGIEEQGSLTKEDKNKVSKIKNFLSQNEDLKIVFYEDLECLDSLWKSHGAVNPDWNHKQHFGTYFLVCALVIITAFILGERF